MLQIRHGAKITPDLPQQRPLFGGQSGFWLARHLVIQQERFLASLEVIQIRPTVRNRPRFFNPLVRS
jgi:hypothetical protein